MSVEDWLDGLPARQRAVLEYLAKCGPMGATWNEVASALSLHHGSASGALSALHREGRVVRLKEKRGKSSIYLLPKFEWSGETVPYRKNPQRHTGLLETWNEAYAAGRTQGRADLRREVMEVLAHMARATEGGPVTTHSGDCWRRHPACAVQAVIRNVERL